MVTSRSLTPPRHLAALGSERNRPLHFAGRRAELRKLAGYLAYIREHNDPSGGMVLVSGVQGIGKTQLLGEFVRRAMRSDASVRHVAFTANELPTDPHELVRDVTEGLAAGAKEKVERAAMLSNWVKDVSIPSVAKIAVRQDERKITALLKRTRRARWWDGKAAIVTVDEIQTVDRPSRWTLKVLHEGLHGCPIMLVGAGLQHAPAVLSMTHQLPTGEVDNNAISRFALHLTLARLAPADAEEAIAKGVLAAGGAELPATVLRRLAEASSGFPQHVHGYIAAAIDAAREVGVGNTGAFLSHALARGDESRVAYYDARLLSMSWPRFIADLAVAMAERGGEIDWADAERELAPLLPADVSARSVIESAIEKGVLSRDALGCLSFGIPSFLDYLLTLSRSCDRHGAKASKLAPNPQGASGPLPRIAFLHAGGQASSARSSRRAAELAQSRGASNDNRQRLPRAFAKAGWRVANIEHESLALAGGRVVARTVAGVLTELDGFDAYFVLGFGPQATFLDRMQILRGLDQRCFVNTVDALIHQHGKASLQLACPDVPQPVTHLGNDAALLAAVVAQGGDWIAKPPAGSFGREVFHVRAGAPNTQAILEHLTRDGRYALLQERIDTAGAGQGEKRVLIAAGEVIGAYGKRPADHRANLDVGATARPTTLTMAEQATVARLAARLDALGVRFAAADIAAARVLEINVANPGGLATCAAVTGVDPAPKVASALLRWLRGARAPSARPLPSEQLAAGGAA